MTLGRRTFSFAAYSCLGSEPLLQRYFFDIKDGQDLPDLQGSDWPDIAAARQEAVRLSAEVLKEMPERFWHCDMWTMTVSDAGRQPIFTLKFLAEDWVPTSDREVMAAILTTA